MYVGYEAFVLPLTFRQFISWEEGATDSYRLMEECLHIATMGSANGPQALY